MLQNNQIQHPEMTHERLSGQLSFSMQNTWKLPVTSLVYDMDLYNYLLSTTSRRNSAALTLSATSSHGLTCKSVHHHTLVLRFLTHPSYASLRRKKETKTEHYCVMGWCSDAVRTAGRLLLACGRQTLFLITHTWVWLCSCIIWCIIFL